ncbi:MAG: Sulfopyruvate decarboxylase [Methanocella sp. PtaU1.Bin125]|nr:MAG: Sulfopyruvate decarboxylase [Methanocella sp. PtaU1.Bin125]
MMRQGMNVEQGVIDIMKASGIDTALTLPCDRMKNLLPLVSQNFREIRLMREEGGVGIAAGLCLAGRKPAMVIQSTGIGNSLNVLSSLHKTFEIPLPILASWRGVYKENIPAQVHWGKSLPGVLDNTGIPYVVVERPSELPAVRSAIFTAYEENTPYVVLFSPKVWEGSTAQEYRPAVKTAPRRFDIDGRSAVPDATASRFDMIKGIAPCLRGKIVVSNIGVPSKELYAALDQPTNFYMLGSWGLATPIGIGLAHGKPDREVVVLDGDGSLLFEPNSLGMTAQERNPNLTIVAFDNSAHGSTGNQPTYSSEMDLGLLARAYGIRNTSVAATPQELLKALEANGRGPRFIHVPVLAQNAAVPDIPKPPVQIKREFMAAINR